jgi:hypothetical protein
VPAARQSLADRVIEVIRSWWPVAAFLVPVLVVQTVWSARYDVAGHAADHLQSATPVFPMAFLSAVLLWALPGRGRRDRVLWLLLAAAIASCLVVLAGNVRVIDAIGGVTWLRVGPRPGGAWRLGCGAGDDAGGGVAVASEVGVCQGRRGGGGGQPGVPALHRSGRWRGRPGGLGSSGARPRAATRAEPLTQPQLMVLLWRPRRN